MSRDCSRHTYEQICVLLLGLNSYAMKSHYLSHREVADFNRLFNNLKITFKTVFIPFSRPSTSSSSTLASPASSSPARSSAWLRARPSSSPPRWSTTSPSRSPRTCGRWACSPTSYSPGFLRSGGRTMTWVKWTDPDRLVSQARLATECANA